MNALRFITLLFCILITSGAMAHEIRPVFLEIKEVQEAEFEVFMKVPSMDDQVPRLRVNFSVPYEILVEEEVTDFGKEVLFRTKIRMKQPLRGSMIDMQGLSLTIMDALVRIEFLSKERFTFILRPDETSALIPVEENTWAIFKAYTIMGIEHILMGFDHLLFVLALVIITSGKWKVIKTITAFTLAHSLTLSLSILDLVSLPSAPVETVIALSIVFLAYEILRIEKSKATLTSKMPWLVAFAFGLLHGFGFAGALRDIGLPQSDIPMALFTFNLGVEIGQILFILVVYAFIYVLNRLIKIWPPWSKKLLPYAIGSLASFWVLERTMSFF